MNKRTIIIAISLMVALVNVCAQGKNNFREWAQTPPMGWNSWDCYGPTVTEKEVKANADFMATNLKEFGWEYVVVDIRWFVANDKAGGYNESNPVYVIDNYGRYQPAENRFPSSVNGKGFKALADYVHSKGLKFGIHIMRGIPKVAVLRHLPVKGTNGITADQIYSEQGRCKWLKDNYTIDATKPGAQEYYNSIFEMYAEWGVDFIKIDDLSAPDYHQPEIDLIRKAIDHTGRPIVLSTSPGETPISAAAHVDSHANMWRMVNDVWDVWSDFTHLVKVAHNWYPYIGEGTWPDCDMLPLGHIAIRGERGNDRMTRLTQDEQYSLMTFFSIFRSPLMFGGDLPTIDPFTLSLLTNQAILKMHKDGTDVKELFNDGKKLAVASKDKKTGANYLAVFNISDEKQKIQVPLSSMGVQGTRKAMLLWSGKQVGKVKGKINTELNPHACALYKLSK